MVRVDHQVLVDRPPDVVLEYLARTVADEALGVALLTAHQTA